MNVKVRQALITALDCGYAGEDGRLRLPEAGAEHDDVPPLFPNPNLPKYDFSVDKAKQLLKEGNWNPSRKLMLGVELDARPAGQHLTPR